MINTVARIYFTIAALAAAAAFAYNIGGDDRVGVTLLLFLMGTAALSGIVVAGAGLKDRALFVAEGAPITDVPVGVANTPRPSSWPLLGAVAAGLMVVGMAVGPGFVVGGLLAAVVAAGGWLGQAWRESAGWDASKSRRLDERYVAPLGIPIGTFIIAAIIVIAISRILLAVSKEGSVVIAIVMAVLVLAMFAILASRQHVSKGVMTAIVAITGIGLVGAGVAAAAIGERDIEPHEAHITEVGITAKDTQFDKKELDVPASEEFVIDFKNEDEGVYHNVAVYTEAAGGKPIVAGEPVEGIDDITYHFEIPDPGTYAYRCDFHANMTGTLVAKAEK